MEKSRVSMLFDLQLENSDLSDGKAKVVIQDFLAVVNL